MTSDRANNKKLIVSLEKGMDEIKRLFDGLPENVKTDYEVRQAQKYKYKYDLGDKIVLKYPGKKKKIDYLLEYDNTPLSHADICRKIYNYVRLNEINYNECLQILEETYNEGLYYNPDDEDHKNLLRKIIFWVPLQEEINYPCRMVNGKYVVYGRLLPFLRYAEALNATITKSKNESISEVCNRTVHDHKKVPSMWKLENVPSYYKEAYLHAGEQENASSQTMVQVDTNGFTLADFFSNRGIEIVDKRPQGGCLWVVGNESEIGTIVKEACQKFQVSGDYGVGKATKQRRGWYTKSEK